MRYILDAIASFLPFRRRKLTKREVEGNVFMECYWPGIRYLARRELLVNHNSLGRFDAILARAMSGARTALDAGHDAPLAADIARTIVMMETSP